MGSVRAKIELTETLNETIEGIAKSYGLDKWLTINALLIIAVKKEALQDADAIDILKRVQTKPVRDGDW